MAAWNAQPVTEAEKLKAKKLGHLVMLLVGVGGIVLAFEAHKRKRS